MQEMQKEGISITVTPTERHDEINGVKIYNAHLLHEDILTVIKYALVHEPDEDLLAIFVSPTGPRTAVGKYDYHTRSFCISLPQIMEDAVNAISTGEDVGLNISAHIWIGLIYTIFHELHHNVALRLELGTTKPFLGLDDDWFEQEDILAQEYAEEKVEEAVIKCNAEVPKDIMDIPWMGERIMDYLTSSITDDPDFVRTVKDRLDNGVVFENKDDIFDSLVDYFKAATDTPEKYEEENAGAATEMVPETPNLFDKKILPGEQLKLLPDNLDGSVSVPLSEGETADIQHLTEEMISQKGEQPMTNDVHDHLPEEATMDPETCGTASELPDEPVQSWAGAMAGKNNAPAAVSTSDPFAANFPGSAASADAAGGGGDFPGGRNAEQFYTETAQETANAQNVKVEAQYKREDGSVGRSTHYPAADATAAAFNVLMGLYQRLHQHMFTNDVYQPLMLTDAEKELGLVIGYNTWNGSQVICVDAKQTGVIAGLKYKNGTLPAYDIIINWGGHAKRIKLIAQNPNTASASAARTRAGSKITQILEVTDPSGKGEYRSVIENGVYKRY